MYYICQTLLSSLEEGLGTRLVMQLYACSFSDSFTGLLHDGCQITVFVKMTRQTFSQIAYVELASNLPWLLSLQVVYSYYVVNRTVKVCWVSWCLLQDRLTKSLPWTWITKLWLILLTHSPLLVTVILYTLCTLTLTPSMAVPCRNWRLFRHVFRSLCCHRSAVSLSFR